MLPRVYEYKSSDGVTYWTFHKQQKTVSPPTRLILQDRVGMLYIRFINYLREVASFAQLVDDDGDDQG